MNIKRSLTNIGAVFLMALCSLTAIAQFNGTGYYRVRNAAEGQTNHYISIANDIINFTNIIGAPGGAENLGSDPETYVPMAMSCVDAYLRNDIHLLSPGFIDPATVVYFKKKQSDDYDLIAQGTSLHTLTTGKRIGGRGNIYFEDLYATIISSGGGEYTAYIDVKARATAILFGAEITLTTYNLGKAYFMDNDGTFAVELDAGDKDGAKWIIERLTYFNVFPQVELNGRYYTTLKVPFEWSLNPSESDVKKAYVITGISDGVLQYTELNGTIPAGTEVILECSSNSSANCKCFLPDVQTAPRFTPANANASTGTSTNSDPSLSSVEPADEGSNYTGVNDLKGTYYCNTDGTLYYNTTAGENKGYFYGDHFTTSTEPKKYVIGINDETKKFGFIEASGNMPANKAWLEYEGVFPTVAAPTFSPEPGTYGSAQTVTITAPEGAKISIDGGQTWSESNTMTVSVSETTTIQAIAMKEGLYNNSDVATAEYVIRVANPTLSADPTALTLKEPATGTFTVTGLDLVDNVGVTQNPEGLFNLTFTGTGAQNWGFERNSDNEVNGMVKVEYKGRELTVTGTIIPGTDPYENAPDEEPDLEAKVTVTYQPDIFLYGDFGSGSWGYPEYPEDAQFDYADGVYSKTVSCDNTFFIMFARKAGESYNWQDNRYFFSAKKDGNWDKNNWVYGEDECYELELSTSGGQYRCIELPAGEYTITINAADKTFTITKTPVAEEKTLAWIEAEGSVGTAYTVSDELVAVWAVNNGDTKLLWAKDQGQASIDKRPAKTDEQADYMVEHLGYQHYEFEGGYDWDESNWVILDFGSTGENPEEYVGFKLESKSITGSFSNANDYTITLSKVPVKGNAVSDYPGWPGGHSSDNYGKLYRWAYNSYMPANFMDYNLNRIENGEVVGFVSDETALPNMQNQQLYFMNPKIMEIAHLWGVWCGEQSNKFTIYETSFENNQTVNAWNLQGQIDVLSWIYNRLDGNAYGQPNGLEQTAQDFHAVIVRKPVSNNTLMASDEASRYGIYPLDIPSGGHPTAVTELNSSSEVMSVRYYNVMGMASDKPFNGLNIVVTRYSDGTTATMKVIM